jgi:hypothetical protein
MTSVEYMFEWINVVKAMWTIFRLCHGHDKLLFVKMVVCLSCTRTHVELDCYSAGSLKQQSAIEGKHNNLIF